MALKKSSSTITIGAEVTESAPNTFTQQRVDLQLNPLDNEVFVVTALDIDVDAPDALAGVNTQMISSVTTTSRTAVASLADSACLGLKRLNIRAAGFVDGGVAFESGSMESPPTMLDYIGIISTNDFFIQVQGANNGGPNSSEIKMYGYRAKADAATYAALVQSEVLSS